MKSLFAKTDNSRVVFFLKYGHHRIIQKIIFKMIPRSLHIKDRHLKLKMEIFNRHMGYSGNSKRSDITKYADVIKPFSSSNEITCLVLYMKSLFAKTDKSIFTIFLSMATIIQYTKWVLQWKPRSIHIKRLLLKL